MHFFIKEERFHTCTFPANAGYITFALRGIAAARFELQRTAVPALLQNDFANIERISPKHYELTQKEREW